MSYLQTEKGKSSNCLKFSTNWTIKQSAGGQRYLTHTHTHRNPFENNAVQPQDCQDCNSEIWHVCVDNLHQKVFSIILSIPLPVNFLLTLPSSFFLIFYLGLLMKPGNILLRAPLHIPGRRTQVLFYKRRTRKSMEGSYWWTSCNFPARLLPLVLLNKQ